ncbi:hypothetical protein ABNN70_05975 [Sporolactobacillus sp. Y61]|uniref:Uncharacterized protein n=1 Tax=Sporolactobacillus sp. Y61 TaxID=3160863 RepID=A0AAU8IIE1_9BACL
MAVRQPIEKELLIQDILNLTDEQAKELRKQLNENKKSLLPYEDEILTKEEEQALKESEKGNAKTYSYNEIFGKDGQ